MHPRAVQLIHSLGLQPHPEGGYYKEVFRSEMEVTGNDSFKFKRACTSIYYLLEGNDYSGFHRLASDELWYFHKGASLVVHVIDEKGDHLPLELSDAASGSLSIVVKAGLWFAAEVPLGIGFTLVSCAVAPGFDFSEFEMADKNKLAELYPQHKDLINKLCR